MRNKVDLKKAYEAHCAHCNEVDIPPLLAETYITLFVYCKTRMLQHRDNITLQHVITWNIKKLIDSYLENPDTITPVVIHTDVTEDNLVALIIRSHLYDITRKRNLSK